MIDGHSMEGTSGDYYYALNALTRHSNKDILTGGIPRRRSIGLVAQVCDDIRSARREHDVLLLQNGKVLNSGGGKR